MQLPSRFSNASEVSGKAVRTTSSSGPRTASQSRVLNLTNDDNSYENILPPTPARTASRASRGSANYQNVELGSIKKKPDAWAEETSVDDAVVSAKVLAMYSQSSKKKSSAINLGSDDENDEDDDGMYAGSPSKIVVDGRTYDIPPSERAKPQQRVYEQADTFQPSIGISSPKSVYASHDTMARNAGLPRHEYDLPGELGIARTQSVDGYEAPVPLNPAYKPIEPRARKTSTSSDADA